jgi:hypothetical protein
MENNNLPFSKDLDELIQKNSELLAKDLKQYLVNNNKYFETEMAIINPPFYEYDFLIEELSVQFDNFNKENIYTKEIENTEKFSDTDRKIYNKCLFEYTVKNLRPY